MLQLRIETSACVEKLPDGTAEKATCILLSSKFCSAYVMSDCSNFIIMLLLCRFKHSFSVLEPTTVILLFTPKKASTLNEYSQTTASGKRMLERQRSFLKLGSCQNCLEGGFPALQNKLCHHYLLPVTYLPIVVVKQHRHHHRH